jgi:hypothetical protein
MFQQQKTSKKMSELINNENMARVYMLASVSLNETEYLKDNYYNLPFISASKLVNEKLAIFKNEETIFQNKMINLNYK